MVLPRERLFCDKGNNLVKSIDLSLTQIGDWYVSTDPSTYNGAYYRGNDLTTTGSVMEQTNDENLKQGKIFTVASGGKFRLCTVPPNQICSDPISLN